MKLSNIVSKDLLPDFAESISWVMNALDSIIHVIKARSVSIDAPLTMESIEALTDEELQALYAQYGLALYYPDISRARRNWMLYNMARIWRYLGTPKAVEFLCQYIFSDIDIELKVHDNGAFDEEGRLVTPDLVDVFDIEIIPGVTILPPEANQRILENVIRFSRNSQALRQIYYSYDTFVSQTVSPALPYNGIVAVENVLNEAVCEDSPTPTLPTVDHIGNASVSNPPANTSMVADEVLGLYFSGSRIPYDDTKKYAFAKVTASNGVVLARTGFVAQKGSSSTWGYTDCVEAVNKTGTTQSVVYYLDLYTASNNQAEVVSVYDSSNNAYNAFKFDLSGTDYYYVLDGTQADWTDDLSSIGYSLTKSLPTVSKNSASSSRTSGNVSLAPDGTALLWSSGSAIAYDQNTVCCVYGYYVLPFYGGTGWQYGRYFDSMNQNGYLYAKNITDSTIANIANFSYAVCSDSTATVVAVYNSSNVAYNAFKYTVSGTDYYYVLDGTQTDWTDDLSSIGYYLPIVGYFKTSGSSATTNESVS